MRQWEARSLDRIQIGQVIINLVRNAVEAMEASERRELVVATRAADGAVEIMVSDTGPGIAPEIAGAAVPAIRHDEADRAGAWAVDLPRDRRGA